MIVIETRELKTDEVEIRCLPPGLEVPQSIQFTVSEEKDTGGAGPETRRETL